MSVKKYPRTFWLTSDDIKLLEDLSKRLNIPPRKIVAAALKSYAFDLTAYKEDRKC